MDRNQLAGYRVDSETTARIRRHFSAATSSASRRFLDLDAAPTDARWGPIRTGVHVRSRSDDAFPAGRQTIAGRLLAGAGLAETASPCVPFAGPLAVAMLAHTGVFPAIDRACIRDILCKTGILDSGVPALPREFQFDGPGAFPLANGNAELAWTGCRAARKRYQSCGTRMVDGTEHRIARITSRGLSSQPKRFAWRPVFAARLAGSFCSRRLAGTSCVALPLPARLGVRRARVSRSLPLRQRSAFQGSERT